MRTSLISAVFCLLTSVLCPLFSPAAQILIESIDLSATRAETVTGVQSQLVATAVQPADIAGWEHGPHLDWALSSAVYTLSTNLVTRLFDATGTRWIDGTGGVWKVSAVTNSTMANWTVTVISDIKNGSGTVVATNGTMEVFSDPIGVPPLALSQYAIQNVVHGGYRWSIYRSSDASQLTVFVQNIGLSASQYLSQNMNPPTYTNAICTAWPGGLSSGQCRVTYTPIVYTVSVVTSALPRVAFIDDVPSTDGLASAASVASLSNTVANLPTSSGSSSASALVPIVNVATGALSTVIVSTTNQIYYIEASGATTVTNILPSIDCSSNLSYEIWYNAATTNALAPLWDSRMQFAGGSPDMTCTGVYKIACSSPCGTVIQARQTWPTVYEWQNIVVTPAGVINASSPRYSLLNIGVPINTSTNSYGTIIPCKSSLVMVMCYGGNQSTAPVMVGAGRGTFLAVPATSGLANMKLINDNLGAPSTIFFVSPARTALTQADYIMVSGTGASPTSAQILGAFSRQINELEVAAYAAGWRP